MKNDNGCSKLNLTNRMVKLLTFLRDNSPCETSKIPAYARNAGTLRTAEAMDLVIYGKSAWRITENGLFQVKK